MDNYTDYISQAYTLFRGDTTTIAVTDDEYTIFMRLMNKSINRWENYDATYWKELFSTLQEAATGSKIVLVSTLTYAAPTDMREAGGFVRILNSDGTDYVLIPIIEPQEAQFLGGGDIRAYFTGNPTAGFTMHLTAVPTTGMVGKGIDYVYYKKATELTGASSYTEMSNPHFIVLDAVAQRLQIERNYPGYQIFKRDAEEALKNMQQDNNSGTWANPWTLTDNSGITWGI